MQKSTKVGRVEIAVMVVLAIAICFSLARQAVEITTWLRDQYGDQWVLMTVLGWAPIGALLTVVGLSRLRHAR